MGRELGGMLHIEAELYKERASALRKVGERLEAMIEELTPLRAKILAAERPSPAEVGYYRKLHAEAELQRYHMVVQREAMGIRQHGTMDEVYPLPPALPKAL